MKDGSSLFTAYLVGFYLGFALWGGATQAADKPLRIEVDLNRAYSINGHREIQKNIFGVCAYHGSGMVEAPYREILQRAGIPLLGFSGKLDWVGPDDRPADGIAGIERFYASEEAMRRITTDCAPFAGHKYLVGKTLAEARKSGVEPMVYLVGAPKWIIEYPEGGAEDAYGSTIQMIPYRKDYELYAAICANYVALVKRANPELRYVHLGNEANAYYYKYKKGGADYGALFDLVARAIHAKCPDVMVGGTVACWPSSWPPNRKGQNNDPKALWSTWKAWTKPFLDVAIDSLDFFDYHHYYGDYYGEKDTSPSAAAAALEELTLIKNELVIRGKTEIPIMITEGNVLLTYADWSNTVVHWEKRI